MKWISNLVLILFSSSLFAGEEITFCSDRAEWPPYSYYHRNNDGSKDESKIVGASVDLLQAMTEVEDFKFKMIFIPWKRCLEEVKNYQEYKKSEGLTDAAINDERRKDYLYTKVVYSTNPGFFYSEARFSEGPKIVKLTDLNNYKLCGNFNYVFDMFVEAGITNTIDQGGKSIDANIMKVRRGSCEMYLTNSIEPIYGTQQIGKITIPKGINSYKLNGLKKTDFVYLVAKDSPRGKEIVATMNRAIDKLQASGKAEQLFKQYLPGGSGIN